MSTATQTSGQALVLSDCLADDHGATCTTSHKAFCTIFPLDGAKVGRIWRTEQENVGRSSPACFLGGVKRIGGTRPYNWKRIMATVWIQAGRLVLGVKRERAWIMWIGRHSRTKRESDSARDRTWLQSHSGGFAWLAGVFLGLLVHSRLR